MIVIIITFLCLTDIVLSQNWIESKNLSQWYNDFDLCLIKSTSNGTIESIMKQCENELNHSSSKPVRCIAGNSWPSKSEFCSAADIPFNKRTGFQKSLENLDNPTDNHLKTFFSKLSEENGALLVIGDSVMQQFFSAIACELEREKIWNNPTKFTNTDEIQYIRVSPNSTIVPMQFLPIYHLVNNRFDRIPNAPMKKLENTLELYIKQHNSVTVIINMGLHYIDNPVPNFSRIDYRNQMIIVLTYLHNIALSNSNKNIRIFWRETSAQHFPTNNGYWPGAKYANIMKLTCIPHKNSNSNLDWRNREIESIIFTKKLFLIQIISFYNITQPLWSNHPSGNLQDCTHFCW